MSHDPDKTDKETAAPATDEAPDVVAAPPATDTQDDEAGEASDPATLEDQDNDRAPEPEGAGDGEERGTDGDVSGTVDE